VRRYESIESNLLSGTVTWRMGTDTARDVARFIRENCPSGDLAVRDADLLEAAADRIDGDKV
jgi:hypothetical protein